MALLHLPTPIVSRILRAAETVLGAGAPVTWDEAELLEATMVSARGTADAERLGVRPQMMSAVLGAG